MYIVMDLDATLLNDNKEVSSYSLKVLNKLQKDGHVIVINTARSLDASKDIIKQINADYSILNGGTLITKGLEKIYENVVSNSELVSILKEIKNSDTEEYSIQCDQGLFCNLEEYTQINKQSTFFDYNNEFPYNASKILLKSNDGILPKYLSEKYNLCITHYINGPWYRLSKGTKYDGNVALYNLLKDNDPKDICFGDDLGDIEMLINATKGVALLNSVESVLSVIKEVTKYSNDNDGVARYLEEFFHFL